jgi:hypothetical protein
MSNTPCDLCTNPYPYMCSECNNLVVEDDDIAFAMSTETPSDEPEGEISHPSRIYIGSGEDLIMELV